MPTSIFRLRPIGLLLGLIAFGGCFPEPNDHGAKEIRLLCESDADMNQHAVFVLAYDDQVKLGHLPACEEHLEQAYIAELRQQKNYINEQFYADSLLLMGYYLLRPQTDCLSVYRVLAWQKNAEEQEFLLHDEVGRLQPGHADIQLPPTTSQVAGTYIHDMDTLRITSHSPGALAVNGQDSVAQVWKYLSSFGVAYGPDGEVAWVKNGALHILGASREVYKRN